jgi:uncharacterized protein YraI
MKRKLLISLCLWLMVLAIAVPAQAQTQAVATITVRRASIWAGPGRGFWWTGFLNRNEVVPITGVSADKQWWQVSTSAGVGYLWYLDVIATGTETVPVANPGIVGTIVVGRAVVRGGPGIGAQSLAIVPNGTQFYVIGTRSDGAWLEIEYRYGKGWVAASVTNVNEETAPQDVPPVTAEGPRAIINTGALNVRSGPGFGYSRLGVLHGGEIVPIIGRTEDGTWLQVQTTFGDGWVNIIYVITQDYFGSAPINTADPVVATTEAMFVVLGGSANVRSGPNVGFSKLFAVDAGMRFTILGQNSVRTWWYIDTPWGKGWINAELGQATGAVESVPIIQ